MSPARADIVERLRDQPEPLSLASLVAITGRHENTVREHLTALVRRGVVRRFAEEPAGRGRPRWRYELADVSPDGSEYAGLAAALARTIARTKDPVGLALRAGEDWGQDLARQRDARPATPEGAREEAVRLLDDLGFEPEQDSAAAYRLTRCPLLETAYRHEQVVCAVHLGIVRGALTEYGADPEGSALVPFAEPGACRLVVPPLVTATT